MSTTLKHGGMATMTMADGQKIAVYRAPPQGERLGGLVLLQEIFGVTEHIREQCEKFASRGFEVIAPALFDRMAPGLQAAYSPEDTRRAVEIARAHPFGQGVTDVQTCVDALRADGPVFVTGYCYGGSLTWAAACRCAGIAAAAGYYGSHIPRLSAETPRCPVMLHFGRHDSGIPLADVRTVQSRHPQVTVHLYDAGHGFNSDRRADFHADSAATAFERTLSLFKVHAAPVSAAGNPIGDGQG